MPPRRAGPATGPIAAKAEQQDRPTSVTGCRNLLTGPHDTRAQRMGNRLAHPNRDTLLGKTCDLISVGVDSRHDTHLAGSLGINALQPLSLASHP